MKARLRMGRWGVAALAAALAAACTNLGHEADLRVHRIEQAVVPMARAALAAGQVETARRLYTRLLDVAPNAPVARMGLGDVALAVGRPARAATWYLDAANMADGRAVRHAALLAHGRASIDAGHLDAARRSFERLVSPTERADAASAAWAHNGLAIVAMLEGNPKGTVAAVERAVLLDPDEQRFRDNLARAVAIADAYRSEAEVQMVGPAETLLAQAGSGGVYASDQVAAAPAPLGGNPGDDDLASGADVDGPVRTAEAPPPAPLGAEEDQSDHDACSEDGSLACGIAAAMPTPEAAVADADVLARRDGTSPQDDAPRVPVDRAGGPAPVLDDAVASGPYRAAVDGDGPRDPAASAVTPKTDAPAEALPVPVVAAKPQALAVPREPVAARPEKPSPAAQDHHPAVVGFLVQGADGDYLQVGAFAVAANARRLAERLPRVTDLPVGIEPPGDMQPALYRVRIGPIPSRTGLPLLMQALRDGAAAGARRAASTADSLRKPAATS